uniref:Bm1240, isoform a n=1 Tax=Brugia malayi TaxID=6279 RepID=A0A1I9G150_BRUMA|nr:Bm1240, isoform a [Brugia malayi]
MSGTETQFCKTYLTDEVFPVGVCFCRTYDISAPACNSDPKMISMAKRMLIIESRFVYLHKLNTAGNLWCLSSPFYAKIIFDGYFH